MDVDKDEFLHHRVVRATALPPVQRSPEVAAFLAAVQLPEQVASLLPLQPDGTPALPLHSIDTRQRVLLACLKYFQVNAECPVQVVDLLSSSRRTVSAYSSTVYLLAEGEAAQGCLNASVRFCWPAGLLATRPLAAVRGLLAVQRTPRCSRNVGFWTRIGGGSSSSITSEPSIVSAGTSCAALEPASGDICLAQLLPRLVTFIRPPADGNHSRQFSCAKAVADFLAAADSFAGLHLSLQRLQEVQDRLLPDASPLPSVAQLRCACLQLALDVARDVGSNLIRSGFAGGKLRQRMQAALPTLKGTLEEGVQQHPDSLKLLVLASEVLSLLDERERALHHVLRCSQLAQQQGSDYFLAAGATSAIAMASVQLQKAAELGGSLDIGLDQAEAALAAFVQAEPALKRCKRMLPLYWLAHIQESCPVFQPAWSGSWERLRLLRMRGSPSRSHARQAQAAQAQPLLPARTLA
ncbi:hypothetical protein ABPG77_006335 [Micractinium sp. CCAP 211/92]